MHALPSLMRFLAVLIVLTPPLIACAAEADAARVGFVNKVENDAPSRLPALPRPPWSAPPSI